MGHGIFPNYGLNYIKTWMQCLSKKEKKEAFFPTKKSKIFKPVEEDEEEVTFKKKK